MKGKMNKKLMITSLVSLCALGALAQSPTTSGSVATDSANATIAIDSSLFKHNGEHLTLSLEEAQKYAIEHNRSLQNADMDIKKAEYARWEALSSMLPQITAELGYSNYCGYKMNFSTGGSDDDSKDEQNPTTPPEGVDLITAGYIMQQLQNMMGSSSSGIAMPTTGTLNITASIAISGAQIIALQISKLSQKMMDITYKNSEQETKNQVKTLYYSALVMEETIGLLEKNFDNLKSLLESTEKAVEVGVVEQTDADKLRIQVITMQTGINSTKRSLEMVYNSLRLLLGTNVDADIELSQKIDQLVNINEIVELLNKDFSVDDNYQFQLLEASSDLSKKQVDIAFWNHFPTLSAYYQHSERTYFGQKEGFNMTPPNLIGASLRIPIFSSGNRYSAYKEAKISYAESMNNVEQTRDALLVQHNQLRYNLASAYDTYITQQQNVDVTQQVFDKLSQKFEHGMVSSLELTNSSTNLISAQSSYVQALMELISAQVALENLLVNSNK